MFSRKRLIYSFIALVVIALAASAMLGGTKIVATTVILEKSTLTVSIRNEGQTRLIDSYVMTSPVSGELKRVPLEVGDVISKGSVIFHVSPPETSSQEDTVRKMSVQAAQAQVELAHTSVRQAEDTQSQAEIQLDRLKALHKEGVVTDEQLEQATLSEASAGRGLASARLTLRAAEAELTAAKTWLTTSSQSRDAFSTRVTAPTDGNVLRIFERNQTIVMAGTPVLEIGNTRALELVVDVLSEDAVQIRQGNPVLITGWGGASLSGTVRLVEPAAFTKVSALGVEEQRVNVLIDFDEIPETLGVGYRVEAAITIQESPETLTVPVSAIFQESGEWFTFAVANDTIEKRSIKIGTRAADRVAVESGVVEGDEVVLYPSAATVDGARIKR